MVVVALHVQHFQSLSFFVASDNNYINHHFIVIISTITAHQLAANKATAHRHVCDLSLQAAILSSAIAAYQATVDF